MTVFVSLCLKVCWNWFKYIVFADCGFAAPNHGLHANQVNKTDEVTFSADWKLKNKWVRAKAILDHANTHKEVSASAVQLIYKTNTGNAVLICLTPNGFGLWLYTGYAIEYCNCAIKYAKGTLNFNCEVHVAWGVNDVDRVIFPSTCGGSRGDCDATLLLLFHPVHGCCTFVHFTDLVIDSGVKQDALGRRGFARVDVRHDPDVAGLGEVKRCFGSHLLSRLCILFCRFLEVLRSVNFLDYQR